MGFPRQEYWSGLAFPTQGMFPTQGLNPGVLHCMADSLLTEPPEKPIHRWHDSIYKKSQDSLESHNNQ